MSVLASSPTVRRLAATTALAAITALALGICNCETPRPTPPATDECHSSVDGAAPQPSPDGAGSTDSCCSGDPELLLGAPEALRVANLLATGSAFATQAPALNEVYLTPAPAPSWLVAASPPHAPPPAFTLPLRV